MPGTGITLSQTSVELTEGESITINANIPGESSGRMGNSMNAPTAKFVYSYDGVDYEALASYRSF